MNEHTRCPDWIRLGEIWPFPSHWLSACDVFCAGRRHAGELEGQGWMRISFQPPSDLRLGCCVGVYDT